MKKLFFIYIILPLLIVSCDNMDRDDLLNGFSAPDSGNTLDENNVPDDGETEDNYVQPDDENTGDPICGNTIVESGESCDSNSSTCSSILGDNYEGNAPCKGDCSGFDTSSCTEIQLSDVVYEIDPAKCNGCGKCIGSCDFGALTMSGGKAVIDPDKCTGCGDCVNYCPRGAIKKK